MRKVVGAIVILVVLIFSMCLFEESRAESEELRSKYIIEQTEQIKQLVSENKYKNFYYDNLAETEKEIYNQIYEMLINQDEYTKLEKLDYAELDRILKYVIYEHPEIIYKTELKYRDNKNKRLLINKIVMSPEEIEKAELEVEKYMEKAISGIDESMTEYEKALYVFEFIRDNTVYEKDSPYNQSIYSVVLGKSVCAGYSKIYKCILDRIGINNIIVFGTLEEGEHSLNLVQLDGEWCYIDCASVDEIDVDESRRYLMFGLTTKEVEKFMELESKELLPISNSIQNNYYYRNGGYIDEYNEEQLREILNSGKTEIGIKCSTAELYEEVYENLYNQKKVAIFINRPEVTISTIYSTTLYTLLFVIEQ